LFFDVVPVQYADAKNVFVASSVRHSGCGVPRRMRDTDSTRSIRASFSGVRTRAAIAASWKRASLGAATDFHRAV